MRIGINLDDTLCKTQDAIKIYEKQFLKIRKITSEDLWNDRIYRLRFFNKHLKEIYTSTKVILGIKMALKYLRKNHEVFIITQRDDTHYPTARMDTLKYLIKNHIIVDGIFFNCYDKGKICKMEKLDILIDNDITLIPKLNKKNIRCILYDEKDQHKEIEDRITSWVKINKVI